MNCKWLLKLENLLNTLSEKDWASDTYKTAVELSKSNDFPTDSEFFSQVIPTYFKIKLKEFEQENLLEFFELLNLSILSGESFHMEFIKVIDRLISSSGNLIYSELNVIADENLRLSLEDVIKEEDTFLILKQCLIEYRANAKFILRLIENPSLNTLFDMSDQTNDILEDLNSSENDNDLQKKLLLLVKNNLILLRKDFTLKYEIKDLQSLLVSKNELKICKKFFTNTPTSSLPDLTKVLIEKSVFLIRKFIIRKYREDNVHNENYVFLSEEIDFNLESHKLELAIFDEWDHYSVQHFLSEDNIERQIPLKQKAKKILRIGVLSATDFHCLTKYNKDFKNNTEDLEELFNECENIPIENYSLDSYAISVMKNYIANNLFSENLRQISFSTSLKDITVLIEKDLKQLKNLQEKSQIDNFFPFYKICDYLSKYIDEKISTISFDNNSGKESLENINQALNYLKEYLNHFKNNLKWSKNHLNYAYQLPFNECLTKHEIEKYGSITIFTSSAFSLPIDYTKYDSFSLEIEAFLIRIENEVKSITNVSYLTDLYNKDRTELQNEIKNNFKKNIEILGIFSAIIALLFQTANTSQSAETFQNKFLTLLVMFVILLSFLLMLRSFISRKNEISINQMLNIVLILFIPIVIIVSLILFKVGV